MFLKYYLAAYFFALFACYAFTLPSFQSVSMLSFISTFLLLLAFSQVKCMSATSQQIQRRQAHGPRSIINTSVRSSNSTNIALNFQTKIYVQPQIVSLDGLSNRGIMGERRITTCTAPMSSFHHSHCRHREDVSGSLREYIIWCRHTDPTLTFTGRPFPAAVTAMATVEPMDDLSLFSETGMCAPDEICVDSIYAVSYLSDLVLTANCVNIKYFKDKLPPEDLPKDEDEGAAGSSSELAGKTASVVVSKDDNQTPLQVQGIDMSLYDITESDSSSGLESNEDAAILQENNCTDCFELRTTKAFTEQAGDLKLELNLMGAGSAALTGVLWVALMTG